MDDFVTPEPVRLTLSDGQFVDIRKRLTHGESEAMYERMGEGRRWVRTAQIVAYVLGWSLTKTDPATTHEVPVPMAPDLPEQTRIDTIHALDQTRAVEIYEAITAHERAMTVARTAQKKTGGRSESSATSISPATSAGATSGSDSSTPTSMP